MIERGFFRIVKIVADKMSELGFMGLMGVVRLLSELGFMGSLGFAGLT